VELTDSDTPYDIPNLHLTVPLDGTYLVSYSTTFEAYVSDESIHTLDVSSVLYNDTQNSYIPEGKARTSMKFGNDSTTDLISKTRKMIHTVSKDVFVDADASDTIKLMGIHEDTFDNISATSLHTASGSTSINSLYGYLSYEKASFFSEATVCDRIYGQVVQNAVTTVNNSETVADISGLEVRLPVSGKYRINYGITCKASTSSVDVPVIEVVGLLYNNCAAVYLPEGRTDLSLKFGSETEEDLISENRYITGTISKSAIVSVAEMCIIKVQAMYVKPTSNDATMEVLYQAPINGYDGIKGYLSFEKMGNL